MGERNVFDSLAVDQQQKARESIASQVERFKAEGNERRMITWILLLGRCNAAIERRQKAVELAMRHHA